MQATGLACRPSELDHKTTVAGQCRILTDFADIRVVHEWTGATIAVRWHTPHVDADTQPLEDDPRPADTRRADSLLLVNTGDGKGKSSAAFGVMLRAINAGWPVAVMQFIKSGDWKVGEEKIGRQLGVEWHSLGQGFTWDSTNIDHDKRLANDGWNLAKAAILAGDHRLIILDEVTYLCTWGWIDVRDVVATLADRPRHVNVVVTGRDCPSEIIDIADTVTEMRKVKHAYDSGIDAKRGIEY